METSPTPAPGQFRPLSIRTHDFHRCGLACSKFRFVSSSRLLNHKRIRRSPESQSSVRSGRAEGNAIWESDERWLGVALTTQACRAECLRCQSGWPSQLPAAGKDSETPPRILTLSPPRKKLALFPSDFLACVNKCHDSLMRLFTRETSMTTNIRVRSLAAPCPGSPDLFLRRFALFASSAPVGHWRRFAVALAIGGPMIFGFVLGSGRVL